MSARGSPGLWLAATLGSLGLHGAIGITLYAMPMAEIRKPPPTAIRFETPEQGAAARLRTAENAPSIIPRVVATAVSATTPVEEPSLAATVLSPSVAEATPSTAVPSATPLPAASQPVSPATVEAAVPEPPAPAIAEPAAVAAEAASAPPAEVLPSEPQLSPATSAAVPLDAPAAEAAPRISPVETAPEVAVRNEAAIPARTVEGPVVALPSPSTLSAAPREPAAGRIAGLAPTATVEATPAPSIAPVALAPPAIAPPPATAPAPSSTAAPRPVAAAPAVEAPATAAAQAGVSVRPATQVPPSAPTVADRPIQPQRPAAAATTAAPAPVQPQAPVVAAQSIAPSAAPAATVPGTDQQVAMVLRPTIETGDEETTPRPGRLRVGDFLAAREGDECLLALPTSMGALQASIEAFAIRPEAVSRLGSDYERESGLSLRADTRPVSESQCSALTFARSLAAYPNFPLRLTLTEPTIRSGTPLQGVISGLRKNTLYLIIVDDEGKAELMDADLAVRSTITSFSAPMTLTSGPVSSVQLLIAVASDGPLETVPRHPGMPAEDYFSRLATEIVMGNRSIAYGITSFEVR